MPKGYHNKKLHTTYAAWSFAFLFGFVCFLPGGFQVISVDAVLEKAKPFGAVPIPGKGRHWFMLPNGIKFELKEK